MTLSSMGYWSPTPTSSLLSDSSWWQNLQERPSQFMICLPRHHYIHHHTSNTPQQKHWLPFPKTAGWSRSTWSRWFFQILIRLEYQQYYIVYYEKQHLAWTRLPMGHPLAPPIMQRLSTTVARHLHNTCNVTLVAYLDDWLIFRPSTLPVHSILQNIQDLGITINREKFILDPTRVMVYLGLSINWELLTITPTSGCLSQLLQLTTIIHQACQQDLQRIAGYVTWLCYTMVWPLFIANLIRQRNTFYIHRLLQQSRRIQDPLHSRQLYTVATLASVAALFIGPPRFNEANIH
jgi:hypothetical protein